MKTFSGSFVIVSIRSRQQTWKYIITLHAKLIASISRTIHKSHDERCGAIIVLHARVDGSVPGSLMATVTFSRQRGSQKVLRLTHLMSHTCHLFLERREDSFGSSADYGQSFSVGLGTIIALLRTSIEAIRRSDARFE